VEEELLRRQPSEIRAFDEAARLGTVVVPAEVGNGTILEAKRDSLSLYALLSDTTRHPGDIDERPLRTRDNYLLDVVVVLQTVLGIFTCLVTHHVQFLIDVTLEQLLDRHTRLGAEPIVLGLLDELQGVFFMGSMWLVMSDMVTLPAIVSPILMLKPVVEEPKVHDHLQRREEVATDLWLLLSENDANETFQSRKVSRRVCLRMPQMVSWTIPITGLFALGKVMYNGC
jgi:hypothetical protein